MSTEHELTRTEQQKLRELEDTVERGLETFVEVGRALMEIRDGELWKAYDVASFTDYLEHRWGMARRRGYQLMDAAAAVENVNHGTQTLPANERQARPLTKLPEDEQAEAWEEAVETAPEKNGEKRVTAKHVEETLEKRRSEGEPKDDAEETPESWPVQPGHAALVTTPPAFDKLAHVRPSDDPRHFWVTVLGEATVAATKRPVLGSHLEVQLEALGFPVYYGTWKPLGEADGADYNVALFGSREEQLKAHVDDWKEDDHATD